MKNKEGKIYHLVIFLVTVAVTSAIAIGFSYFIFSERNAFDFYNNKKLVCFTKTMNCYKLVNVK